tara:strand:+ start:343 stop:1122 length:780 start_codon:yes stop_codon:yes gene_type:complete
MNILVTNDDGVENPGIWALARAIKSLGNVTVVAPANNQSGVGTGLSLRKSLRIENVPTKVTGVPCYSVGGTPADSVILGIEHVLKRNVDIVVSGINPGFNTSRNVFLSGTIGAAIQAAGKGVTACAFSMELGGDLEDSIASKIIATIAGELLRPETKKGSLFNVNLPSTISDYYSGSEAAFPERTGFVSKVETKSDGGFEIFSSLRIGIQDEQPTEGSDVEVLSRNKVSISCFDGMTMVHQSSDSTLKRIVQLLNRISG